jgi:hypothetical protein
MDKTFALYYHPPRSFLLDYIVLLLNVELHFISSSSKVLIVDF